jgi:hypothetical protein
MSSKLIHQKLGAIPSMICITSSGSCVDRTIGTASIFQNFLKRIAFPSITGSPANHHIFQSHKTALQSLIIAMLFHFRV